jgi:hypothetical protein
MPEIIDAAVVNLSPAQAIDLALLVDLEARWENLRGTPARAPGGPGTQDLQGKQKAYEAFRARLAAYNKRYAPAHAAELLLNTPSRLGKWCRAMGRLYAQVEDHAQAPCPVHLVEKAYRWADRVADRAQRERLVRPAAPATLAAAIRDLDALAQWCDGLARVAPAA